LKILARLLLAFVFVVIASLFFLSTGSAKPRSLSIQSPSMNPNGPLPSMNPGQEIDRPLPPIIESPEPPSSGNAGTAGDSPPLGYPPPPPPTETPIPLTNSWLPLIMET